MFTIGGDSVLAQSAKLKQAFAAAADTIETANILLLGTAGAGKSSLVNAVFGVPLATAGAGKPITTHFHKYHLGDKPVALFDSVGLEHSTTTSFEGAVTEFIGNINHDLDKANHIHCIWWLVDCGTARFEAYFAHIATTVLKDYPIIFVLNKADLLNPPDRKKLTETIESFKIPNNKGILPFVADPSGPARVTNLIGFDACLKCGDVDVTVKTQDKSISCAQCSWRLTYDEYIAQNYELLIQRTLELMPEQQQRAFITAQRLSTKTKVIQGNKIVRTFMNRVHEPADKLIVDMVAQLGLLWGFTGDANINTILGVIRAASCWVGTGLFSYVLSLTTPACVGFTGLLMNSLFEKTAHLTLEEARQQTGDLSARLEEEVNKTDWVTKFFMIKDMVDKAGGISNFLLTSTTTAAAPVGAHSKSTTATYGNKFLDEVKEKIISDVKAAMATPVPGTSSLPCGGPLRVLCMDGGGMRGLVTLEILELVERLTGKKMHELFQVICGTSTGGILAIALGLLKMRVQEAKELYLKMGSTVFSGKRNLINAPSYYQAAALEELLKTTCANRTLATESANPATSTPYVFVVSNIATLSPLQTYLFRNYPNSQSHFVGNNTAELWKAARATSAAPVYFEPFVADETFIDGGLGGNNPTAICLAELKTLNLANQLGCILSVGTGSVATSKNWSYFLGSIMKQHLPQSSITDSFGGVPALLGLMPALVELGTATNSVHYLVKTLLPSPVTYIRFNPVLSGAALDEVNEEKVTAMRTEALLHFGNSANLKELQQLVESLLQP